MRSAKFSRESAQHEEDAGKKKQFQQTINQKTREENAGRKTEEREFKEGGKNFVGESGKLLTGTITSRSGWTAMLLGAGFMACAALVFLAWPRPLLRIFTTDLSVISAGVPLLFVAALFQLFDGLQSTTTGALRGAGDTRTPVICNLVGHWVVGLPTGYFLCFVMGWNVVGLWSGLATGLTFCGIVLVAVWSRRVKRIAAAMGVEHQASSLESAGINRHRVANERVAQERPNQPS